jgi:hypothetical protein
VSSRADRFRLVHGVHGTDVADGIWVAEVHDRGLTHARRDGWPTMQRDWAALGEPIFVEAAESHASGVWELDGAVVQLTIGGSWLQVQAAATDAAAAEAAVDELRARFPLPDPSSSHEVPVTFWTYTPHGPMPSMRTIAVPEWDEIRENYAARTRERLEAVMRGFRPAHGGQLVLWHGTAGTGKTFALRALAWEWRDWCQLHYVVDPDTFFGQHADYLMNVLMQPAPRLVALSGGVVGRHGWTGYGPSAEIVAAEDGDEAEQAWRLLVLEDTGELLTPDAKTVIGQGLSRFLNVVDGLLGQGLRVLVLVTTNEEIKTLHPAVARPGRAAANIEFEPLGRDEAAAWLRRHGVDSPPREPRTLATLYAQREGRDPAEGAVSVGFAES